ncbi:MAG: hypothetical protein ACT6FD_04195 [Methanosarcinaceae archaeon]
MDLWNEETRIQGCWRYVKEDWTGLRMGDVKGEFQGGSIDVMTADDVKGWKEKMAKVMKD